MILAPTLYQWKTTLSIIEKSVLGNMLCRVKSKVLQQAPNIFSIAREAYAVKTPYVRILLILELTSVILNIQMIFTLAEKEAVLFFCDARPGLENHFAQR